jgi:hypothetical protein
MSNMQEVSDLPNPKLIRKLISIPDVTQIIHKKIENPLRKYRIKKVRDL